MRCKSSATRVCVSRGGGEGSRSSRSQILSSRWYVQVWPLCRSGSRDEKGHQPQSLHLNGSSAPFRWRTARFTTCCLNANPAVSKPASLSNPCAPHQGKENARQRHRFDCHKQAPQQQRRLRMTGLPNAAARAKNNSPRYKARCLWSKRRRNNQYTRWKKKPMLSFTEATTV